ncbi:MAG: hypothetical protein AAB513_03400 [Patescibacteria group bacterium]
MNDSLVFLVVSLAILVPPGIACVNLEIARRKEKVIEERGVFIEVLGHMGGVFLSTAISHLREKGVTESKEKILRRYEILREAGYVEGGSSNLNGVHLFKATGKE